MAPDSLLRTPTSVTTTSDDFFDAVFICPSCGRPHAVEEPPESARLNAKVLAGITWLTSAALIGYLAYRQWTIAETARSIAISAIVSALVTLFFGARVLWRPTRSLLTWSVVWAAVIVTIGVLQSLGILRLGSAVVAEVFILATIAVGAAGLQSFVARRDMPVHAHAPRDVGPPRSVATAEPSPPPALTFTPPSARPFAPPPAVSVAPPPQTVVGGHLIFAPPPVVAQPPVVALREDRTSPVLVLLAILTGLLALAVVGYAVLAPGGGLLAGLTPTPTPTAAPTPARTMRLLTPPPFADTVPLTFGVEYDPESLVIANPATKFNVGVKEIAWNAALLQPAGVTSLTFRIARLSKAGVEEVLFSEPIPLSDPTAMTVAATSDMSGAAKNRAGTYVVRLLRGAVVLAEGTFTLVK